MTFSAITSAGSGENVDMIDKGEVDFAIFRGFLALWHGKERRSMRGSLEKISAQLRCYGKMLSSLL